jgi:hypothetical protein
MAIDSLGNLYLADSHNNEIRKISYETTFLSLSPHSSGSRNGWNNAPVTATLSFADLAGGSGTATIYAGLDGATPAALTGNPATVAVTDPGTHTLVYYSVDSNSTEETHQSMPVNIDSTAPSGTIGIDTDTGSGDTLHITFQDGLSGLAPFLLSGITNATLTASDTTLSSPISLTSLDSTHELVPLTNGITDTIQLVATRAAAGSASLTLNALDQAGNLTAFDPTIQTFSFLQQGSQTRTFDGVKSDQGHITALNGAHGISDLMVAYNGQSFQMANLQPFETRRIDVSSAYRDNGENTMTVTAQGDPGSNATVVLTDLDVVPMNAPVDLNGDGKADIRDVVRLLRVVAGAESKDSLGGGDVNGDGAINIQDAIVFLRRLLQAPSIGE